MKKPMMKVQFLDDEHQEKGNSRRRFLKLGGLAVVGSSLMLYSCEPDSMGQEELDSLDAKAKGVDNKRVFNLGKGDLAILNYAYILEQLEAAFYTRVVAGSYYLGAPANEQQIFGDIHKHELIHRDFFELALNSVASPGRIAPHLEFDFSSVDFSSRDNVLAVSQILEDTGVEAYNGAGNLIEDPNYLLIAGKIVSVEARHASTIRNLIDPGSINFASPDILVNLLGTGKAYDKATDPRDVLAAVAATGFLTTKLITNNVPTA